MLAKVPTEAKLMTPDTGKLKGPMQAMLARVFQRMCKRGPAYIQATVVMKMITPMTQPRTTAAR
jgi:hypothetical protein